MKLRNRRSPRWRRWLGPEHRCLEVFTGSSEYHVEPDTSRTPVWFARGEDRPMTFFARDWTRWTSVRKFKEVEVESDLYGFLTTEHVTGGVVHPKAIPVILTEPEEREVWPAAPFDEARELQRPVADDILEIVGEGARQDPAMS